MIQIENWHYNTHQLVTRIPDEVGAFWEKCYGVKLEQFQCTPAPSNLNGSHTGRKWECDVYLAMSECGYCLIQPREEEPE